MPPTMALTSFIALTHAHTPTDSRTRDTRAWAPKQTMFSTSPCSGSYPPWQDSCSLHTFIAYVKFIAYVRIYVYSEAGEKNNGLSVQKGRHRQKT